MCIYIYTLMSDTMYMHMYVYIYGGRFTERSQLCTGVRHSRRMVVSTRACCSVLPHCNTLQHARLLTTKTLILQHTATHCNTLQHTATHCNTLQLTATHCNTLQHTTTHSDALRAPNSSRMPSAYTDAYSDVRSPTTSRCIIY